MSGDDTNGLGDYLLTMDGRSLALKTGLILGLSFPVQVIAIVVGQFTGDFSSFYALTPIASDISTVLLPMLFASPILIVWGMDT